jgi:pyruvate,orthophosphate dikinase
LTNSKWIYSFGGENAEGKSEMRNLLGGKGANLAEMSNLGLPVPPGFTITTEVCAHYTSHDNNYPSSLKVELEEALANVENIMGLKFGDASDPLLVSVRSGARASMPGMMDTVLNLGLNDETVKGLANASGDERFAYDSYRRFIQMYGDVVLGVEHYHFEDILADHKDDNGFAFDTDLEAKDWKIIVKRYADKVESELGAPFPQNPNDQLWGAISAVFGSWMNNRAGIYRKLHDIPESWGTAVNIQSMVFGNMGNSSATGVCFTRNPSTGENTFYGEYLVNAQGEDVVAGIRTPQPLTVAEKELNQTDLPSMEENMPALYQELCIVRKKLETHYKDMQDMEFTVQDGKLWMLQTRNGKRTGKAALKIAVEMSNDGLITKEEAVKRIEPGALDQLLHPTLDPDASRQIFGKGLPASPGAACGKVAFSAQDAESIVAKGDKVILVRIETSPEDIGGMHAAEGILTTRGGMTSHAAVVARGMGRPCVAGAGQMHVDYKAQTLSSSGVIINSGDVITIDGSKGEVMLGEVKTIQPELTGDFGVLMNWVDEMRLLKVRANAETIEDAETAVKFGAEGIGLSRTEHMFFDPERIIHMREMILAGDEKGRRQALDKLLPYQRDDFTSLFTIMKGLPVTIRLLDPPLHEFLPTNDDEISEVADAAGTDVATVRARAAALHESNPMLGLRGCRLGIVHPEIYEMQCRAIFEASAKVSKESGQTVVPEVMIPLIGSKQEYDILHYMVQRIASEVSEETGISLEFLTGTMIELPRACLLADKIAENAEFFSFGTNDLTQTTFGLSRDDSGSFLEHYQDQGIFNHDPFVSIDREGVGELIELATKRGRKVRSNIKLGICGEHGGDPASVIFCHQIGLDYVSCSPYRVPIARLAAAQAALKDQKFIKA